MAVDKNNIELGKITRIDKILGKTIKVRTFYVIVLVNKRFKKNVLVPIDCKLILEIEENNVIFDITKEAFEEEEKRITIIRTEREKFGGTIPERTISKRMWVPYDPLGTSYKKKEKK